MTGGEGLKPGRNRGRDPTRSHAQSFLTGDGVFPQNSVFFVEKPTISQVYMNQIDDFYWFNEAGQLHRYRAPSPNPPGRSKIIVTVPGSVSRKDAIKTLRRIANELQAQGQLS